MTNITVTLFITVLVCICHQIAGIHLGSPGRPFSGGIGRYRDPFVVKLYNRFCLRKKCGFDEVCEQRVRSCPIPPCQTGRYCLQTSGVSTKPGICPPRKLIKPTHGRLDIQCNTDFGCRGKKLCCHGFRISRCMRPLRIGISLRPRRH